MAFQCSWSGDKLKQKFLEHLKNACTFNHIIKFCNLLISGQELIKETKEYPEDSDRLSELQQKADAILEPIKDIIASVTAEVIIQKISEALDRKIEDTDKQRLTSFLSQIQYRKSSVTSMEYLESLINHIDHVVKSYWNSELYSRWFLCTRPAKNLKEFRRLVRCASYKSPMKILGVILQITKDGVEVSPAKKKQWQGLLLEAADVIKEYVKWDAGFRCFNKEYISRLRSCIQWVLAFLVDCSIEHGIEELDKLNDCKTICDDIINRELRLPVSDFEDLSDDDESKIIEHIEINDDEYDDEEDDIGDDVELSSDIEISFNRK